ncbi:hypothetical protein [Duganella sp. HH105]|uniref:hypothetical protein n=1 Tax=Duganella sp. HH105 TaxID=1781067 RepID=UPI000877D89F|nr:hypothetical protein [Duganella sp. HH105]OEZ55426.1 hypothetical protein DUGA6_54980 [Duganella sp. HH105]
MPYIRVIDGVMQEFDETGMNVGPVATIALNSYSYLERRQWNKTTKVGTGPNNPDYTDDLPFLHAQGYKYVQVMMAPFSGAVKEGAYFNWGAVVGEPKFNTSNNSVSDPGFKDSYWDAVKALLDCAVANKIGVIACPFWRVNAICEMVGESFTALTDANSKTRNYMRVFAAAFVARFGRHAGVAAWMANQEILNVAVGDVPVLNYDTASAILKETATIIRANDPLGRMISSGNAGIVHRYPKTESLDWYTSVVIPKMNPDPIDCICENLFINNEYVSSAMAADANTPAGFVTSSLGYLKCMQAVAAALKKPYFVGSFGVSTVQEKTYNDSDQTNLKALLANMGKTGVQLAAFWVWNGGMPMEKEGWNVLTGSGTDNGRIQAYNALTAANNSWEYNRADPVITRSRALFYRQVLQFSASRISDCYFNIPGADAYASADFSVSFTIRQIDFADVTREIIANTSGGRGWKVLEAMKSHHLQLWSGITATNDNGLGSNDSGRGSPPPGLDSGWIRCTYTVKHDGAISFYANDFLLAQQSKNMSPPFLNNIAKTPIMVGRQRQWDVQSPGATATWQMSDLILYDRVLTAQEVFDYGVYRKVDRPVGRWTLDGDLKDSSVNANTGLLNGNHGVAVAQKTPPVFVAIPG